MKWGDAEKPIFQEQQTASVAPKNCTVELFPIRFGDLTHLAQDRFRAFLESNHDGRAEKLNDGYIIDKVLSFNEYDELPY